MIRQLYSLGLWAAQGLLRAKLRRRGRREPGYLVAIPERFGDYRAVQPVPIADAEGDGAWAVAAHDASPVPALGPVVWVHAVSLGETRTAAILVAALRAAVPGLRLVLTHGTATGRAAGQALLRAGDVQVWQPWDTPAIVRRFLHRFQPVLGLLLETEVWPNYVAECQAARVPLVLVNARLSDKTLRQSLRLASLMRPAYQGLTAAFAQSEDDAARLRQLGAPVRGVFGNLKFDAQPDVAQIARAQAWRARLTRPVLLFASAREGEEAMWLDTLQALCEVGGHSDVHWLVVPRHPQRFDEVAALMRARGWRVARRSAWGDDGPTEQSSDVDGGNAASDPTGTAGHATAQDAPTLWLGDSLGEMALYYALADVALLGGSFAPLGGQNLIEACACGCLVVMGPHTFNFAEAAALAEEAGAALRVADMAEGVSAALQLAEQAGLENAHVQACAAFSARHRGAARRTVQALLPWLVGSSGL